MKKNTFFTDEIARPFMHNIKFYFRRIQSSPKYFFLNVGGLTVGILSVFFIFLIVYKELNADKFHEKGENIYRLLSHKEGRDGRLNQILFSLGPLLKEKLPEVEEYVRINYGGKCEVHVNEQTFGSLQLEFIDPHFTSVFSFKLLAGSENAFAETPDGLLITESLARKFFGSEDPINQVIRLTNDDKKGKEGVVVGVLEDFPEESTFCPQLLGNNKRFEGKNEWGWASEMYLQLERNANPEEVENKILALARDVVNEDRVAWYGRKIVKYELQPLLDIYHYSADIMSYRKKGDPLLVKVITFLGTGLLLLISINYVLLNLGISSGRQKEHTTRKFLGATQKGFFFHFVIETVLNFLLAFGVSLLLYPLLKDQVNQHSGFEYSINFSILLIFFILLTGVGILTAALLFFLSEKALPYLANQKHGKRGFLRLSYSLVTLQLIAFIFLTSCIVVVYRQINFIREKDFGFDHQNTYSLPYYEDEIGDRLHHTFSSLSYVRDIARGAYPHKIISSLEEVKVEDGKVTIGTELIQGDHRFLNTYKIRVLAGRNLKRPVDPGNTSPSDKRKSTIEVLVNEEFIRKANLKEPLGTVIKSSGSFSEAVIVGIIEDIHLLPLHQPVVPIIFGHDFSYSNPYVNIAIHEGFEEQFLEDVKQFYSDKNVESYLDYFVQRMILEDEYKNEIKLLQHISAIALLVFLIGGVGLIANGLYMAEVHTKEIGIRKVNGAKTFNILQMLNSSTVKSVVLASLFACPIAWYAMDRWLQNFAYKTELSWWIFLLAGLLALTIALLTVSWQSWRAASRNPVESLRYE